MGSTSGSRPSHTSHHHTACSSPRCGRGTRGAGAQPGKQRSAGSAGCDDSYPGNDSAFRSCTRESCGISCLPSLLLPLKLTRVEACPPDPLGHSPPVRWEGRVSIEVVPTSDPPKSKIKGGLYHTSQESFLTGPQGPQLLPSPGTSRVCGLVPLGRRGVAQNAASLEVSWAHRPCKRE